MATDASYFDEADLNAFTDGRLEPVRAAALSESLASDRSARARIEGWKRQNDSLRTLFASVLFEPVPVRLLQTTVPGTRSGTPPITSAELRAISRGWSAAGVVAGAVGVALVGFMAGTLATIATDGFGRAAWGARSAAVVPAATLSALAGRAVEAHRAALADPERAVDLSTADEARLQHWMFRQLSGSARIPDLHALGWKLLEGRVVSGRFAPAAFLLYGRGAERLGLYLAREPTAAAPSTTSLPDAAMAISSWSESGLGAALVGAEDLRGSVDEGGLEAVLDAVQRQISGNPLPP